jgi:hypothetical protein
MREPAKRYAWPALITRAERDRLIPRIGPTGILATALHTNGGGTEIREETQRERLDAIEFALEGDRVATAGSSGDRGVLARRLCANARIRHPGETLIRTPISSS